MLIVSPRVMASASRVAAPRMPASVCGSGISARTVGSRKLATSSTSTPRPARMRASNSGTSWWRCAIASARAASRSSSRSRQARPQAERSTPRKRRRVGPVGAVRAIVISGPESRQKSLRYWMKPERSSGRIALVGEPIDAARTRATRPFLHRRDQRTPESEMARAFGDEQVLQVAIVSDRPARAMEEVVHDAAEPPADIGAEHVHRFSRIVQARPGHGRGLVGDHDLVEGLVALPQRLPLRALIRADGPDHDIGCGHATTPKGLQRYSAATA